MNRNQSFDRSWRCPCIHEKAGQFLSYSRANSRCTAAAGPETMNTCFRRRLPCSPMTCKSSLVRFIVDKDAFYATELASPPWFVQDDFVISVRWEELLKYWRFVWARSFKLMWNAGFIDGTTVDVQVLIEFWRNKSRIWHYCRLWSVRTWFSSMSSELSPAWDRFSVGIYDVTRFSMIFRSHDFRQI